MLNGRNRSHNFLTGLQDKKRMIYKTGTWCFVETSIQLMAGSGVLLF
jgi:hypothetical protein